MLILIVFFRAFKKTVIARKASKAGLTWQSPLLVIARKVGEAELTRQSRRCCRDCRVRPYGLPHNDKGGLPLNSTQHAAYGFLDVCGQNHGFGVG